MRIVFFLAWLRNGASARKIFKSRESEILFREYLKRISQFATCEIAKRSLPDSKSEPAKQLWVCERGENTRALSSEEVSRELKKLLNSGCRELQVVVGGADGFSKQELQKLNPGLLWSFGPLTLAHELAAIVAGEQIYRAWTIIEGHPYHLSH